MAIEVFDPNQPVSAVNPLPVSAIMQLGEAGAEQGTAYSPAPYAQPGVSAIAGSGPAAAIPGNPDDVPLSAIVRAG